MKRLKGFKWGVTPARKLFIFGYALHLSNEGANEIRSALGQSVVENLNTMRLQGQKKQNREKLKKKVKLSLSKIDLIVSMFVNNTYVLGKTWISSSPECPRVSQIVHFI